MRDNSLLNSNSLESDCRNNLGGGLPTVVRTGLQTCPTKAFHLAHPLRRRLLSPIRLHDECDSLTHTHTVAGLKFRSGDRLQCGL